MGWRKLGALGMVLGLIWAGGCSDQDSPPPPAPGPRPAAEAQAAGPLAPPPAPAEPLRQAPPHQEPGKYLELASSALSLGDNLRALGMTEQAAQAIWQRVPLSLTQAVLVSEPARGYGVYQLRLNNNYLISGPERPVFPGKGMPVYVYLEPVGYRVRQLAGGDFQLGLAMDVALYDVRGKHLFSKKDFIKISTVSHHFLREYFLNVTVSLKGAPPGRYKLLLTVKDLIGEQKTSVELPIVLALAPLDNK